MTKPESQSFSESFTQGLEKIKKEVSRKGKIQAIFLGGSLSSGTPRYRNRDGEIELESDSDIFILIDTGHRMPVFEHTEYRPTPEKKRSIFKKMFRKKDEIFTDQIPEAEVYVFNEAWVENALSVIKNNARYNNQFLDIYWAPEENSDTNRIFLQKLLQELNKYSIIFQIFTNATLVEGSVSDKLKRRVEYTLERFFEIRSRVISLLNR